MAKKIEILENTLLKLLVRRGINADRQNITLSEGELGYTTDSKRLFVGDSSTAGGIVTGNKFLGSVADHTSLTEGVEGDIAYNTTNNILYTKTATGWDKIAQIFEAANGSIIVNDTLGTIAVGTLSSQHLSGSNEITGNSIELVSGQISLSSSQIKTNRISAYNTNYLSLPQNLSINSVNYAFPTGGLGGANSFLKADASGNLRWAAPESSSSVFFNSSAAAVPVGTVVAAVSGRSMPTGWLLANGQSVAGADYPDLSAVIGNQYGGNDVNFNLPDYEDSTLYGVNSNPAGGTEYHLGTGTSGLSAKAVTYFIKALADNVITSNITVTNGLTASVGGTDTTDTAFSLLDNNIEIGLPVPGIVAYDTAGTSTFTTKATYTKFRITGSGAKGGTRTGGAAATVYGILSAPIGTTVSYTVGAGQTASNSDGNPSFISIGGTELARSVGAEFQTSGVVPDGTTNTGNLSSKDTGLAGGTSNYVLGGYVIPGGRGGWDTNNGGEDVGATASYWGADNAPGAGAGGHNGDSVDTADGIVQFEWGM